MIPKRPGGSCHGQSGAEAKTPTRVPRLDEMEAIEPIVRAILDDVVIDGGVNFISNYASWVRVLRGLPAANSGRVFVQLAVVAGQFLEADCKSVATSLAVLARIGLPASARRIAPFANHSDAAR